MWGLWEWSGTNNGEMKDGRFGIRLGQDKMGLELGRFGLNQGHQPGMKYEQEEDGVKTLTRSRLCMDGFPFSSLEKL